MIKEAAGFLQNIVDPMLERTESIVWYMDQYGFKKPEFMDILRKAVYLQIAFETLRVLRDIVIAGLICYTVWRVM